MQLRSYIGRTLGFILLIGPASMAWAENTACSTGGGTTPITLDVANAANPGLNDGRGGCEATDKFFSNFLVTSSGSGNAPTGAPGLQILGIADSITDPTSVTAMFSTTSSTGQFSWNQSGATAGSSATTAIDFIVAIDPAFTNGGMGYRMFSVADTGLVLGGLNPGDSISIQHTICVGLSSTPCGGSYGGQVGTISILATSGTGPSGVSTGPFIFLSPADIISIHTVVTINVASTNTGNPFLNSYSLDFEQHAVPEPSTLTMLGAGLFGIGVWRKRRK